MIFLVRGRTVDRRLSALDMTVPVSDITDRSKNLLKNVPFPFRAAHGRSL
jgi:hypothetical protein